MTLKLKKVNRKELFQNQNVNKLTEHQQISIEGELTIKEIGIGLKNKKNKKTPGLDSFTAEFLKFFWPKLKYFLSQSLNQSYATGNLPQTLRTCVITCLPKQNKSRLFLKKTGDQFPFLE